MSKLTPKKIMMAVFFAVLFTLTWVFLLDRWNDWRGYTVQLALFVLAGLVLTNILPKKRFEGEFETPKEDRKLSKRTLIAGAIILLIIPFTIYTGMVFLKDRKYYFISLLIILEILVPFILLFGKEKYRARELIVISVLCAMAVVSRSAFFMIPQFKPVMALIIISGVCLGGEAGFLVGAITAFMSNMFSGQGPWTPWQMFVFGIIGFLAGVLFKKGLLKKEKTSLCIFGGFATLFIFGGIMNPASVLMWQPKPTAEMFVIAFVMGFPFDLIHAASTVFFLWFISEPMIEKLDRIKTKYGLI